MILVDTDVLLIELRYQRDARWAVNHQALGQIPRHFAGKLAIPVWTPEEWMKRRSAASP